MKKVVCALAALLLVSGCGSGGSGSARPSPSEPPSSPPPPATFPLTGTEGEAEGPVLVVKVENADAARPQSGLEAADLVFEELVEGGETRFAAVYHSQVPESVGPVRSVRPMDAAIVGQFGGLFAYSGGIPDFVEAVRSVPSLVDVGEPSLPEAYTRSSERVSPHNLYLQPQSLPDHPELSAPEEFASFGEPLGVAAGGVDLPFSPRTQVSFTYDAASGAYLRSQGGEPFATAAGGALAFTNVLVLSVEIRQTSYRDAAGTPVPETILAGSSGKLHLLSAGVLVEGTWQKADRDAPFTFTDSSGAPLLLSAGSTAVELLPSTAVPTLR